MYDFTRNRRIKTPSRGQYSSGSTTPSPTLSPGTSSNVTNLYSSPWSIYHSRHLSLLSNRHKLHRFPIFPKFIASSAAPFPITVGENSNGKNNDDQAKLEELCYDNNFGLDDKAVCWTDKKISGNMAANMLKFDGNTNNLLEKMLEKSKTYIPTLQAADVCHLTLLTENNSVNDSGYAPSDLSPDGDVGSLKYDKDWPSSPDGTFLTPMSIIRWTQDSNSEEILNLEYEFDYLLGKVCETKIVTAVFEAQDMGLEELAENFDQEMYAWIEENNKTDENNNFDDQGHFVAVCCEIFWSVPSTKRNVNAETKMKQGFSKYMRNNNWRVWNTIDKINDKSKRVQQSKFVILPASSIEEQYTNGRSCFTGSYKRFYDGLMPMKHAEAQEVHRPIWNFERSLVDEDSSIAALPDIPWPMIGSQSKTSVLVLNLLCLRFEHL